MYLYFFDLDDTICNTKSLVDKISKDKNIYPKDFKHIQDFYIAINDYLYDYGFGELEMLDNSTTKLLKKLVEKEPHNVFYITAREGRAKDDSKLWLKKHNLHINDEKLIMDTHGIKGLVINDILQKSSKNFALLFDDLVDNHLEAAKYKNIISCYPY